MAHKRKLNFACIRSQCNQIYLLDSEFIRVRMPPRDQTQRFTPLF